MTDSQIPRLKLQDNDIFKKLLHDFQRMIVDNPDTVKAVAQALVAEGHEFAATPEGQIWLERASQSKLVKRGRLVWQAFGIDAMITDIPPMMPSERFDLIVSALEDVDLESILSTLMVMEVWFGTLNRS